MKFLDVPQSGKYGVKVSQQGRFGQFIRALALVANPRTAAQMSVRGNFSQVTAGWRALTAVQQAAWISAAAFYTSTPRCGTSGVLTGQLLYNKVNCVNLEFGAAIVDTPPARPTFGALAITGLTITNTGGTIALKLNAPTDPGETTFVRACPPLSNGYQVPVGTRVLGPCPAAVATLTALGTNGMVFQGAKLVAPGHVEETWPR